MKSVYILCFCIMALFNQAIAQIENGPKEITSEMLSKIKQEAILETTSFRQSLDSMDYSAQFKGFIADTFLINRVMSKMMEIDYSTFGINNANDYSVKEYDVMLNANYNLLMNRLKGEDKKVLKDAQLKWIAFRDAELHLLGVLSKEGYSGGGTIQTNLLGAAYADRILSRVIELVFMSENMLKE